MSGCLKMLAGMFVTVLGLNLLALHVGITATNWFAGGILFACGIIFANAIVKAAHPKGGSGD